MFSLFFDDIRLSYLALSLSRLVLLFWYFLLSLSAAFKFYFFADLPIVMRLELVGLCVFHLTATTIINQKIIWVIFACTTTVFLSWNTYLHFATNIEHCQCFGTIEVSREFLILVELSSLPCFYLGWTTQSQRYFKAVPIKFANLCIGHVISIVASLLILGQISPGGLLNLISDEHLKLQQYTQQQIAPDLEKNGDRWIVIFYAHGCKHCERVIVEMASGLPEVRLLLVETSGVLPKQKCLQKFMFLDNIYIWSKSFEFFLPGELPKANLVIQGDARQLSEEPKIHDLWSTEVVRDTD